MTDFEKQSYWHDRFQSEQSFEWLLPSSDFMEIIGPHLSHLDRSSRIMQLGFGTSDLQNHFRAAGFLNVTNIDYEPLAIARGREAERRAFGDVQMSYKVADATCLERTGDEGYDLILEKSTVDAISCGGEDAFLKMAKGVHACLKPGAVWISLSYSAYRFDVDGLPFDVEVLARVPTPKRKDSDPDIFHHCYLLKPKDGKPWNSRSRGYDAIY